VSCTHPLHQRLRSENLGLLEFADAARGWQSRHIQDIDAYDAVGIHSPAGMFSFLRQLAHALDLPPGNQHHVSVFRHRSSLTTDLRRQLNELDPVDNDLYEQALEAVRMRTPATSKPVTAMSCS
jgi:hypothetical protein